MGLRGEERLKLVEKAGVMTEKDLRRTISRLTHEILEANKEIGELVIIGIRSRGVPLADRIAKKIYEIEGQEVPVGILDITLYRDDLTLIAPQPIVRETQIPFNIDDKIVILVDDVLYTGRTIRSALDALIDFGRPRAIHLVVLIDRGHKELPIRADYVGKNIPTSKHETIEVRLKETDGVDGVIICELRED